MTPYDPGWHYTILVCLQGETAADRMEKLAKKQEKLAGDEWMERAGHTKIFGVTAYIPT